MSPHAAHPVAPPRSPGGWWRRIGETTAEPPLWLRYGTPLLLAPAAAWLAAVADPLHDRSVFLLLFPVVVLCAVLGGSGSGLLAAALGAAAYFLLPAPAAERSLPAALAFLALGGLTAYLVGSLRRARVDAERQRVSANQFAATLHLRLMLAEKEIGRQSHAREPGEEAPERDDPGAPPA